MCPSLDPGPDYDQPERLLASEQIGRQSRCRRRSRGGDGLAVDQCHGRAGLRVERDDDRLVRGPIGVAREQRDELRRESTGRGQVRRHRGEQPIPFANERRDAGWHRRTPSREIRERRADSGA